MGTEIERKYLLKELPANIHEVKSKKLVDIYIPRKTGHAKLRIRQQGEHFFIHQKDKTATTGVLVENQIDITEEDFDVLKTVQGQIIEKTRYYYPTKDGIVEIDVFEGKHKGLLLAEVEFSSKQDMNNATIPDFCTKDVTGIDVFAGGVLCKLTFADIEQELNKH